MKKILTNNLIQSILGVLSRVVGFILLFMGLGFLVLPDVFAISLFIEPVEGRTMRLKYGFDKLTMTILI